MKKENKRDITEVLDLLAQRDPDWKHPKLLHKFKILYQGWAIQQMRHNKRNQQFYSVAWRRNWLPFNEWRCFRDYAMQ